MAIVLLYVDEFYQQLRYVDWKVSVNSEKRALKVENCIKREYRERKIFIDFVQKQKKIVKKNLISKTWKKK